MCLYKERREGEREGERGREREREGVREGERGREREREGEREGERGGRGWGERGEGEREGRRGKERERDSVQSCMYCCLYVLLGAWSTIYCPFIINCSLIALFFIPSVYWQGMI